MSADVVRSDFLDLACHRVQLYGSDTQRLVNTVGQYLREGLQRGDGLLVIATAEHSHAFMQEIRDDSAYQSAVQDGRLAVFDAEIMLSRCMVEGRPDWARFETVVGDALRQVRVRSTSTCLRVYGEMVGLLWTAGAANAAVRLEEYWNCLAGTQQFELFCAYPIDVLADEPDVDALKGLLCAHSHLVPGQENVERAAERALGEVFGDAGAEVRELAEAAGPHLGDYPWKVMVTRRRAMGSLDLPSIRPAAGR